MTPTEQKKAAKQFIADWTGRGDEKQETQSFWIALLQQIFGVDDATKIISFEQPVKLSHTSFIDAYIPSTHVLIEQKSMDVNLKKYYKQSDSSMLTPYQQARRYAGYLPHDQNPRWIVVSNFQEFHIHDMNRPNDDPEIIKLSDLEKEYHRLQFLVDTGKEHIKQEMEISLQAGEIVGRIYDTLLKEYKDPDSLETLRSLNMLCVRLVFCLYAEDAGIFGRKGMFHDYLKSFALKDVRKALIDLFKVLDTKPENRDPYMEDDLAAFPYVNGGLFADENIEIPRLNAQIVDLILDKASENFDWAEISPTIFGAVFESTLNPETRRSGGMHYTSIENIHKVIDPLFLDDLTTELEEIKGISVLKTRQKKLKDFQKKLSAITIFDPACGSGNFLTESYLSLRRLENEALREQGIQIMLGEYFEPIQMSISQFYGIEINDFAVSVAKTALWIAEAQMFQETMDIVHMEQEFLPLETNAYITEGNALRIDWETVVPKEKLSYIIGNPPFVGYSLQSNEQKNDILSVYVDMEGKPYKTAGKIDYVAGWYFKAAQLMLNSNIRTAFVSTNSITQGEQVASVWKPLYERFGIHIDFAHRTFRWDSEASIKAHVHCVIVGFSIAPNNKPKVIYSSDRPQTVENINAYLADAETVFIESRSKPLCPVLPIKNGGKPAEGGFLILSNEEKEELLKSEPQAESLIRPYMMGKDFIDRKPRFCLWMVGANPTLIQKCPKVLERIEKVRQFRLDSKKAATNKKAETPMLFVEIYECTADYVAIPVVSSENRKYIPIDYLSKEIIAGNKLFVMSGASLYNFGVLTSNIHMAWVRAVCGRLKSDYSYSNTVVYNNFPWPAPTDAQKAKIEETAQAILDARALYPDSSLADLYDERTMPQELRKAHQANDKAVMAAYGWKSGDAAYHSEAGCVAELMKMYRKLTQK